MYIQLTFCFQGVALKNKKVQVIFEETFILTLSSAVFRLQNRVADFF